MKTKLGILIAGALLALSCSELKNSIPVPVAPGVRVHGPAWIDPSNADFHGRQLLAAVPAWNDQSCQSCHGGDYAGGTAGVACFSCHDPYPHSVKFAVATGRHVGYLRSNVFPLQACQACHGSSFTGGPVVAISCEQSGCHVDASGNPKSPETCNTCHGTFNAPANLAGVPLLLSAAPPRDVAGDTSAAVPGVGAHQKHLITGTTGKSVQCQECHTVPNNWTDPGHIPAATMVSSASRMGLLSHARALTATALTPVVLFNDTLANYVTGNGALVPHPSFDPSTLKCSNTYCHGNWMLLKSSTPSAAQGVFDDTATVIAGVNATPVWNAGSVEGQCTSCHNSGPGKSTPAGHIYYDLTACYLCHGDVTDASGNILNRSKHINGVIDLVSAFGGPRPMK